MVFDQLYRLKYITAEDEAKVRSCNFSLFSGVLNPLNALTWFVSRSVSNLSAVFVTIYLFRKRNGDNLKVTSRSTN